MSAEGESSSGPDSRCRLRALPSGSASELDSSRVESRDAELDFLTGFILPGEDGWLRVERDGAK
jgi:hypothetical protein